MAIACIYCIASKGLTLRSGHLFQTEEEFFEHLEMEHDIPVSREDETEEQTIARFRAKNPRAGGPDCQCPTCLYKRAKAFAMVDRIASQRIHNNQSGRD